MSVEMAFCFQAISRIIGSTRAIPKKITCGQTSLGADGQSLRLGGWKFLKRTQARGKSYPWI